MFTQKVQLPCRNMLYVLKNTDTFFSIVGGLILRNYVKEVFLEDLNEWERTLEEVVVNNKPGFKVFYQVDK